MIGDIVKKYCCEDLSLIENYDKAIKDKNILWHCHHRLETHDEKGNKRLNYLSSDDLIKLNLYYKRPANELIFLMPNEHINLHKFGIPRTEEDKIKMREAYKNTSPEEKERRRLHAYNTGIKNKGRKLSPEAIENIRKGMKGNPKLKHRSERQKEASRKAMLGKHRSDNTKENLSNYFKGMKFYNNGIKVIRAKECPEGYVPGKLSLKDKD